jgi:hypothetical protein
MTFSINQISTSSQSNKLNDLAEFKYINEKIKEALKTK